MKRLFLFIAVVASLTAACGGSKGDDQAKLASSGDAAATSTSTVSEGGGDGTSSTTKPGGAGSTPTTKGGSAQGGEGANGATTTTAKPIHPTATLDKRCVRKGLTGDSVTLSVKTKPGDAVGYTTRYSDGSTKYTNPEYEGGDGYGNADEDGKYSVTWKVPASAPEGEASVKWVAMGAFQTEFPLKIVGPTGRC